MIKFTFLLHGPINNMVSAQSFFGAFCSEYQRVFGKEELINFLDTHYQNPIFAVSSFFYKDTIVKPINFNIDLEFSDEKLRIKYRKLLKKVEYVSIAIFNDFRLGKLGNKKEFDKYFTFSMNNKILVYKTEEEQYKNYQCASVKRIRNAIETEESSVYVNEAICFKNVLFDMYLEVFDKKYHDKIITVIEKMKYCSLGGKKSIGYNLYSYFEMTPYIFEKSDKKILLSNCIGDKSIDIDNSQYNIIIIDTISNQRETNFLSKLVLLRAGSIIKTNSKYVGNIIEITDNDDNKIYQHTVGMVV